MGDKPNTFRCHAPQIKKEDRKENQMRRQKLILHHWKMVHVPPKVLNYVTTLNQTNNYKKYYDKKTPKPLFQ